MAVLLVHQIAGRQDTLLLKVTQDQASRGFGMIKMPIELAIETTAGTTTPTAWCMNTTDPFVIPIDAALVSVVYDPDEWVLTYSETIEPWGDATPICQGDINEDGEFRGDDIEPFIAAHEVPLRPGRIEPRVLKRRRDRYPLMHDPRDTLREALGKT